MKTIKRFSVRPVLFITLAILFFSMIAGCSKSSTGSTVPANQVYIHNMAFNPSTLTVAVNTTVTWTNQDDVDHTVTSTTSVYNSPALSNGSTFSYKFTSAGTFNYICSIHTYMTGKVIVQ